jgi:hypothetical protein
VTDQTKNGGYVRLYRALLEHPIYTQLSPKVLKVWITCLLRANWKATKWYDGIQQVEIPAGGFIFSQNTLAELCHLSRKELRTALKNLKDLDVLEIWASKGASRYSLLVIENWTTYQSDEPSKGQAMGQGGAKVGPQKKKLRREENTPYPLKGGGNGIPLDPDELPFATTLEAFPPEVNGKNRNSAAKTENRRGAKVPVGILEIAERIHKRHPNAHGRRDCSATRVTQLLSTILRHQHITGAEMFAYLERIDRNHAAMCASEMWQKDDGQYVKSLENWLVPSKERYLNEPPAPKPAQSTTSIYTEWDPPGFKSRLM